MVCIPRPCPSIRRLLALPGVLPCLSIRRLLAFHGVLLLFLLSCILAIIFLASASLNDLLGAWDSSLRDSFTTAEEANELVTNASEGVVKTLVQNIGDHVNEYIRSVLQHKFDQTVSILSSFARRIISDNISMYTDTWDFQGLQLFTRHIASLDFKPLPPGEGPILTWSVVPVGALRNGMGWDRPGAFFVSAVNVLVVYQASLPPLIPMIQSDGSFSPESHCASPPAERPLVVQWCKNLSSIQELLAPAEVLLRHEERYSQLPPFEVYPLDRLVAQPPMYSA